MRAKNKTSLLAIPFAATLFLCASILLSLRLGATSAYDEQIFWLLRVPRVCCAIVVGGGLAVAGVLIQATLGNPLADPFTIGVASAAALGAVVGALFKTFTWMGPGIFAFVFSLGAITALGAWLRHRFRHATEVLLAGVIMSFFLASLSTLILAVSDPSTWMTATTWLMGSLSLVTLSQSTGALFAMLLLVAIGWLHWKPLDLICIDELTAESAGVEVAACRKRMFFLVALMTALAVSLSGVIGFVGLIVPHALRRLGLRSHQILIPTAFIGGAALLLSSDLIARTIVRPSELPVGVVTALLGAPFFLLLSRRRGVLSQ